MKVKVFLVNAFAKTDEGGIQQVSFWMQKTKR